MIRRLKRARIAGKKCRVHARIDDRYSKRRLFSHRIGALFVAATSRELLKHIGGGGGTISCDALTKGILVPTLVTVNFLLSMASAHLAGSTTDYT